MSFDPLGLNKPLAPAIKGYIDPSLDHDAHVSHLNTIVVQVGRNKSGLEAVIAGAGEWLTSEDDKARERAALLLAELFERLPKLDIDSEKLRHIVLFLCERMNDFPSAAGSVRALLAIALGMPSKLAALRFECDEGTPGAPSTSGFTAVAASVYLSRAMHSALHVPQLGQQLRARSFRLLSALFALDFDFEVDPAAGGDGSDGDGKGKLQRLRHIGPEWSRSLAAAMANEKDPRCLMVCLRLVERTLQLLPGLHARDGIDEGTGVTDADEAPCATSAEALFDAVACYFPITFTPPPNDPNRISPAELRGVLRGAMLACTCNGTQPAAMQWLAALLHEKLQSTHEPAKREAARCVAALATGTNASAAVTALAVLASPTPVESSGCGGDCGGGRNGAKPGDKEGVDDGHNMLFALGEALLLQAMYGEHLAGGDAAISDASQPKTDAPGKEADEATDGGGSGALALKAIQALFHAASNFACASTLTKGQGQDKDEDEGEDEDEGAAGTAHGAPWRALQRGVLSPTSARLRLEARETGGMGSVQARAAARVLLAIAAAGAKEARRASTRVALPLLRAQFAARTDNSKEGEGSSGATAAASVADEANVWLVVGLLRAMCAADSALDEADASACKALLDLLHGVLTSCGLPDTGSAVDPVSLPSFSQRCSVLAVCGMEMMLKCTADTSTAEFIAKLQHRCVHRLACAVWSPETDATAPATIDVDGALQIRLRQDCLAALERLVEKHAVDSMTRSQPENAGRWRALRAQLIDEHVVAPAIRALEAGSASPRTIVPLGALPSAFGVIAKKLLLQASSAVAMARRVELLQALAAALGQLGRTAVCENAVSADEADGDAETSIGSMLCQFVPELCSFITTEFSPDGDRATTSVAGAAGEVAAAAIVQCTRAGAGRAQTVAARQLLQCVVRTCAGATAGSTNAAMPLLARVIAYVPVPAGMKDDEVTVFSALVEGDSADEVAQYVQFLRMLLPHATGSTAHDGACASVCAALCRAGGAQMSSALASAGESDAAGTIAAAHCVAALVNKLPAGSALDAVLDELLNGSLLPILGLAPVPIARGTAAATASTRDGDINNKVDVRSASALYSLLWVMRALVLRSHPIVPVVLSRLTRLLEAMSPDHGRAQPSCSALSATGFGLLLRDGHPPLDPSERGPGTSVTRSSLLHKQRFLSYARSNLLGKVLRVDVGSDSATGIALSDVQEHKYALQAFLSVVQHVPLALWMTAADWGKQPAEQSTADGGSASPSPVSTGIMTLLLLGMRAGDTQLKAAALSVCVRLLSTPDGLLMVRGTLAKAARTFLHMAAQAPQRPARRVRARPQLVTAHSADPPLPPAPATVEALPAASRIDALRCVELLTKLPYYLLHPHRSEIEKGLALPLDDPKRAVRQCAVIVRNTWMGASLGAAGT